MFYPYDLTIDKKALWNIYNRCTYIHNYNSVNEDIFKGANAFIENEDDIEYIETNIVQPFGLDLEIVRNEYVGFGNNLGFNFNILRPGGFANAHRDTNKTKINILLNESTQSPMHWIESGTSYYYEYPVLVDVSLEHMVKDCHLIKEDRVTLQIFLTESFDYCKKMIDANRSF
jgi:hypothetical protein